MKMKSRQKVGIALVNFIFLVARTSGTLRRIIPSNLVIREGEDMQLRLIANLTDEISCYVRTPWLESINLKIDEDAEDGRIKYWTENNECGVQVKNIRKEDQGWWRLTSKNDLNQTLVDAVNVEVLDKVGFIENNFTIVSGLGYDLVLAYGSKFCVVKHPSYGEQSLEIAAEDCKIDLQMPTEANAGNWIAEVGVKGQIEEALAIAKVTISPYEHLDYGYKTGSKFLHFYCNLFNYDDEPDLCRFSQPGRNQTGFHLNEGLRKGRYGYFGNGLMKKECGLTIEEPTIEDYEMWHCLVGKVGKNVLGAYIRVPSSSRKSDDVTFESVSPVITTFSKELILECSTNLALKYCWFSGPNGTILTPTEHDTKNSSFYSYFGKGLNSGKCGVKINSAEEIHNGTWTCHMGPDKPGFELTANIDVRISETSLAARNKVVFVQNIRDPVTLQCQIVPNRVTLQYCRFYSPSGIGIHINEEITQKKALVIGATQIWFSGTSTKLGDCGITFQDISSQEIGTWRCAGRLEANKDIFEAFDTIEVHLKEQEESENLTAAASAGIAAGVVVVLIVIIFAILYLKKRNKGSWIPYRFRYIPSAAESPRESQGVQLSSRPLSKSDGPGTSGLEL